MVLVFGESRVELEPDAAQQLFEELWRMVDRQPGAVVAAGRIRDAFAYTPRTNVPFYGDEETAVRAALAAINR
jgi:hypothetical protein